MDSRNDSNRYYNDYPIQGGGQQTPPYYNGAPGGYNGGSVSQQTSQPGNGKGGGSFLLGMLLGVALTTLICGFTFVGMKVYETGDRKKEEKKGKQFLKTLGVRIKERFILLS